MPVIEFWAKHGNRWPKCQHCNLPAVLGDDAIDYLCWWHGKDLMTFTVDDHVYLDVLDEVPWIQITEEQYG